MVRIIIEDTSEVFGPDSIYFCIAMFGVDAGNIPRRGDYIDLTNLTDVPRYKQVWKVGSITWKYYGSNGRPDVKLSILDPDGDLD